MSKDTIFFDFYVRGDMLTERTLDVLSEAFDEVIIGGPGIVAPARSDIVPDCGGVRSDVVIENMPIRLVLYAKATIEVFSSAMRAIQRANLSAEPSSISIKSETGRCNLSITGTAEDVEIRISVDAREELRTALSAEKLLVKLLESDLFGQAHMSLRQTAPGEVVISASVISGASHTNAAAQGTLTVQTNATGITLSSGSLEDDVISIMSGPVGAIVAYYRTISDLGTDTLADVGGLTLSKLFFTEVR